MLGSRSRASVWGREGVGVGVQGSEKKEELGGARGPTSCCPLTAWPSASPRPPIVQPSPVPSRPHAWDGLHHFAGRTAPPQTLGLAPCQPPLPPSPPHRALSCPSPAGAPALPRGTGDSQPGGHPPESSTSQLRSLPWEPCVHSLLELGPCSHSLSHRRPSITTGVIHISGFSLLLFSILRNTLQNFHHHKNRTSVAGGGDGGC